MCDEWLPAVADTGLADAVDAFCEGIAFTPDEVERLVGLRMQLVPLEDDEPRVDAAPPQRVHVRPGDPGRVDRAMDDP